VYFLIGDSAGLFFGFGELACCETEPAGNRDYSVDGHVHLQNELSGLLV